MPHALIFEKPVHRHNRCVQDLIDPIHSVQRAQGYVAVGGQASLNKGHGKTDRDRFNRRVGAKAKRRSFIIEYETVRARGSRLTLAIKFGGTMELKA